MLTSSSYTSGSLVQNQIYTRQELRALFTVTDATINTGVFCPKGSKSVWLFVTEKKTSDKVPYIDSLRGDTLKWQGQLSGRTDQLIITHQAKDLELLVFYRRSKLEYPGAGFRYLGRFCYQSHQGGQPTSFILTKG